MSTRNGVTTDKLKKSLLRVTALQARDYADDSSGNILSDFRAITVLFALDEPVEGSTDQEVIAPCNIAGPVPSPPWRHAGATIKRSSGRFRPAHARREPS